VSDSLDTYSNSNSGFDDVTREVPAEHTRRVAKNSEKNIEMDDAMV
jgi:hypothetical protein